MRARVVAAVALAMAACACRKDPPALDAAWFGDAPAPPGKLAGLRPKMTIDEAKPFLGKQPPRAFEPDGIARVGNLGHPLVEGSVHFKLGRVESVLVEVKTKACEAILQQAWGPGEIVTPPSGDKFRRWLNARDGWRVDADRTRLTGGHCGLLFELHRPADAAFFGAVPGPPPALARIELGTTIEAAHAIAPEIVDLPDEGIQKTGWLGPSNVHGFVEAEAGRVVRLGMTCEPEVLSAVQKAWGPGTQVVSADGSKELEWRDPAAKWRIYTTRDPDRGFSLTFERPRS